MMGDVDAILLAYTGLATATEKQFISSIMTLLHFLVATRSPASANRQRDHNTWIAWCNLIDHDLPHLIGQGPTPCNLSWHSVACQNIADDVTTIQAATDVPAILQDLISQ
jgi:hypothetical protein